LLDSSLSLLSLHRAPISTLFPYTTLFRSAKRGISGALYLQAAPARLNPASEGISVKTALISLVLRLRSYAMGRHESCQVRKEARSEEHTSELQSRFDLVCRLLLEKQKKKA